MSLKDVLCQDKAIEAFEQAIQSGRLGHAYIFAGNDGVGRFFTAKQWAKALLCDKPETDDQGFYDSCRVCSGCKLVDNDNHPDFKHIYKELLEFTKDSSNRNKTPNQLSIDVVREFLVDVVASKPQMAKRAVYVVSEAEKMAAPAQNAMLKTLEEPPGYCVIILLCTRTDMLLPTILSRCQVIRFGPINENIIIERLASQGCQKAEAGFWARFTDGSLGQSMMFAALSKSCDCYRIKCELVSKMNSIKLADCLNIAEWMGEKTAQIAEAMQEQLKDVSKPDIKRRAQKTLLKILLTAAADIMKVSVSDAVPLVNDDQRAVIKSMSGVLDADTAAKFVEKVNKSIGWVDAYVNEKLIFEEILLHFAKLKSL